MKIRLIGSNRLTELEAEALVRAIDYLPMNHHAFAPARRAVLKIATATAAAEQRAAEPKRQLPPALAARQYR